ncbi:hypothetical protein GH5_03351 [Leishmania sp. Ghana 2012 LV757]|uniref:hypothetical protein n=1 Tax=Leishmania sp. Ghana 2012 LV757 TaxID=2803181 RepID=UPI001B6B4D89|nr:hypothetical protein GH5_03351 [Leishmania sp. Ghana 2012 LV757]
MRAASSESPTSLRHSAVAVSNDASPPSGYHFPLQSAASIPPCIGNARENSTPSPWRGRGGIDTTSLCDETRSLSSSIRSTRRRRGGDLSGSATGEGKDWTQAFMDLERMRRENQEFLHGSLRGDRSETGSLLDDVFARSRSGSSAISSVRQRRRGVAAGVTNSEGRVASCAPFEHSPSGTPLVADSVTDTPKADTSAAAPTSAEIMNGRRYGSKSGVVEARLTFSPPRAAYSPEGANKQSRSAVPIPGRTSGLPNWLKRPIAEPSRGSIAKGLANTSEAAAVVAAKVAEGEEASLCAPATLSANSPTVNVSNEKPSEAARLSSLATPPAHASSPSSPSAPLMQRTHADPVAAGAPLSLHASGSRTDGANPRGASPILYAFSSSPTTAAATLVEDSKSAYRPTRASQSVAQGSVERQAKAAAAAGVGIMPSPSPRGKERLPPTSGKLAVSAVSSTSPTSAAASTAAAVIETSPEPSAEAPVAAARAAKLAEEKVRSSTRCVPAKVTFEDKPKSPVPQPQLQAAEAEEGWASTEASSKAPAQSKTAAAVEPESPYSIPRAPNMSACRTWGSPRDRPASAMRPTRGVRHSRALVRLPSEDTTQDAANSEFVPRVAASVPRERKHSSLVRLSEGTLSGPSQPKGCDATRPSGGGMLHRSTTLTELRRQEVLRDRLARERKAAEEARARLMAGKQRMGSSFITSNARAVAGCVETRSLSSRQVSRSRRRASAVTRLRVSPTFVTVASSSITTPAASASHLRVTPEDHSAIGAQQSSEGVGVTFSNAQKGSAASTPTAGTPAAGSAYCSRGEIPQGCSLPTGAEGFAHLPKPLKKHPLSRTRPHLPAAAASNNSCSPSTNGNVRRVEQWVSTMASYHSPPSTEAEAFSPAMVARASPSLKATSHAESVAAAMSTLPPSAPSETAGISVTDTGKQRPLPFCVECGHRHMSDLAKFCALCGHQRAYLCC